MSVIGLVNQAVTWYAASAVLAFVFAMRKPLSGAIAGIGGAVASAMLVVAGGAALLMPERIHGGMLQFLHLTIRVGGVNALWLLAIGLSALPVSLFNISWHRHPQVKAIGPLVNLLLAAATCAVVVTNIGSLVVRAEIMALCAAFLTGCAASGKLWFALGRLGTLLMAWTCWLVWSTYGTLELAQINLQAVDMMQNPLLWLPGLVGFALLAGAIPLHGWAPQAHAGASAPAAALELLKEPQWTARQQLCQAMATTLASGDWLALLPILNHEPAAVRLHWLASLLVDAQKRQQGIALVSNPDVWPLLEQLAHSLPAARLQAIAHDVCTCREQLLNVVGVNRELLLTERLLRWEHYLQPGTGLPVSHL